MTVLGTGSLDTHAEAVVFQTSSTVGITTRSAKHYRKSQAGFAGFLVLAVHFLGGLGQSRHGFVEAYAVTVCDLVAGDRIGCPGLDGAERTSFNAWDLNVSGHRVAGHTEVMLEGRFRGVLDYPRLSSARRGDQCRSHCGSYTDLGLASALRGRQRRMMLAEITYAERGEHSFTDLFPRDLASFHQSVDKGGHDSG